jgi:hypothetical protein
MSKFKTLSVGSLPRVFVKILAMDGDNITAFADVVLQNEEMKTWIATTKTDFTVPRGDFLCLEIGARDKLAKFFLAVLNLSKVSRGMFVKDFTRLLNELGQQDFWGTEGQCDPRGDRRELFDSSGY